jgi:hypothetical protein
MMKLKESSQLPYWIELLESILARISVSVQYARAQLQTRAAKTSSCLSEQAHV